MSGARLHGQNRGKGRARTTPADTTPPGPNPSTRGRVAPYDGPASRGSNSAAASQSRASAAPTQSPARSRSNSNATQSQAGSQVAQPMAALPRDPAREGPGPLLTDSIKNVDMPASFYSINGMVSPLILPLWYQTDFVIRRQGIAATFCSITPLNSLSTLWTFEQPVRTHH